MRKSDSNNVNDNKLYTTHILNKDNKLYTTHMLNQDKPRQ